MDDHKKEKRSFQRLNGSLAQRILLTTFFLFAIPLLIVMGFLYKSEVESKKKETEYVFNSLMSKYQKLIEETILEKIKVLNVIGVLVNPEKGDNNILKDLAKEGGFSSLFHLNQESGSYLCDHSSEPDLIGKDFNSLINTVDQGSTLSAHFPSLEFYLIDYNSTKKEAWIATLSNQAFLNLFERAKNPKTPAEITLFDRDDKIIFSTFLSHEKLYLQLQNTEKIFDMTVDGKQYLTLFKNVKGTNFSLMISLSKKMQLINVPNFVKGVLSLLSLMVLIGGGLTLLLTFRLALPLKQLSFVMQKVGQGKVFTRFKKDALGFEINRLGQMFNDMIESLVRHMEEVKKERVEKEKFEQELLIGQSVQSAILPKKLPVIQSLDIGARFISAKEVGGDFYDFLEKKECDENELMISIADTSGKGVSACLYSLNIRSILRSFGKMESKLHNIIQKTNNLFCRDTGESGIFVTSWIALYNENTKKLSFSNCGHHPALLQKKDGQIKKLTTPGIALGVIHFQEVAVESVTLEAGDTLLLFTDGVVEAHNSKMVLFGEKKLHRLLDSQKHLGAQTIVDQLVEDLSIFTEGVPQYDDLTVVVIKVK